MSENLERPSVKICPERRVKSGATFQLERDQYVVLGRDPKADPAGLALAAAWMKGKDPAELIKDPAALIKIDIPALNGALSRCGLILYINPDGNPLLVQLSEANSVKVYKGQAPTIPYFAGADEPLPVSPGKLIKEIPPHRIDGGYPGHLLVPAAVIDIVTAEGQIIRLTRCDYSPMTRQPKNPNAARYLVTLLSEQQLDDV